MIATEAFFPICSDLSNSDCRLGQVVGLFPSPGAVKQSQALSNRYVITGLAVLGMALLQLAWPGLAASLTPTLLYFAVILGGAAWGGLGPGLLASGLAVLLMLVQLLGQAESLPTSQLASLGLFALEGVVISLIVARGQQFRWQSKMHQQALQISETYFRRMVETANEGVWLIDHQDTTQYVNQRMADMLGYTPEAMLGRPVTDFMDEAGQQEARFNLLQRRQGVQGRFDFRLRRKDGSFFWGMISASPIFTPQGDYEGAIALVADIGARRQIEAELEDRVRTRTQQLEAINQELEAFVYSVSHDLRAPIRHIVGFTDLLQRQPAVALLDTRSHHYLDVISQTAQQAGNLIDDLLSFAHMSRTEMHFDAVALNPLITAVQQDLVPETENRTVVWDIAPLPTIQGDAGLLRQAFYNLLSNAVKYTRRRSVSHIQMTSQDRGSEVEIVIADDGIGFDMAYAHKLFGLFQRLHSDAEFPGNGIGLAHVQRIVHRHGGSIRAESTPGQGATFYLRFPKSS